MNRFAGDAAINAGWGHAGFTEDRKLPGMGSGSRDVGPQAGAPSHRSRDAARDAPGLSCHKPKTPVNRRGVSLTNTADYRSGANASPVPLHSKLRGRNWPSGAFARPISCY